MAEKIERNDVVKIIGKTCLGEDAFIGKIGMICPGLMNMDIEDPKNPSKREINCTVGFGIDLEQQFSFPISSLQKLNVREVWTYYEEKLQEIRDVSS